MLTDREQEIWRKIQRRLAEEPDFRRAAPRVEPGPGDHREQVHRRRTGVVTLTLTTLLVTGPNLLTADEVAERRRTPAPRRSSVLSHPAAEREYAIGVHMGRAWGTHAPAGLPDMATPRRPGASDRRRWSHTPSDAV